MLKIVLIRHSSTEGNSRERYVGGGTDESLSDGGRILLRGKKYPDVQAIFVSPMKRCIETAFIIYPKRDLHIIREFKECNFGEFENKSAKELESNPNYQPWVDSLGTLPFPGGESRDEFAFRCRKGFERSIDLCVEQNIETAAMIVHGGTIMAIMQDYVRPKEEDFYHWQVKNTEGYEVEIDKYLWSEGRKEVQVKGLIE